MRRFVGTLVLLLAVLASGPINADCFYYDCNEYPDGSATCGKLTQCSTSSCSEADYFAQSCSVTCSNMPHGGASVCWCSPHGMCYDI